MGKEDYFGIVQHSRGKQKINHSLVMLQARMVESGKE